MTTEEQRRIDEEARRLVDREMDRIPSIMDEEAEPSSDARPPQLAATHPAVADLPPFGQLSEPHDMALEQMASGEAPEDAPPPPAAAPSPAFDSAAERVIAQPMAPPPQLPIQAHTADPTWPTERGRALASPMPPAAPAPQMAAAPPPVPPPPPSAGPRPTSPAAPPPMPPGAAYARARGLTPPTGPAVAASAGPAPVPPAVAGKPPIDQERQAAAGPLPRLDQGLPSEEAIASARAADPWEHLRHNIGAALSAWGGHPLPAFASRADALEAERRTGMRSALAGKAADRTAERTAQQSADRQTASDSLARERLDLQARDTATRERTADALTPARVAQMQASTEHTQATTGDLEAERAFSDATREQRDDPRSTASDGMRRAVRARLDLMGPAQRARVIGDVGPLDGLNANQLHDILPTLMAGVGIRGAGTGSSTATPTTPEDATRALAERWVAHGISPDVESAIADITAAGGPGSVGVRGVLGTRLSEETPPPPTGTTQASIAAAQLSSDDLAEAIDRYDTDIPGVGRIDGQIPTAALSEDGRRVRAMILNLSDNYLRMTSGAAIPEHEVEAFAARLGSTDEPIFREQVSRIRREIAARQTGSAATPSTADHRRPRTQAPTTEPTPEELDSMTPEELAEAGYEVVQ